MPKLRDRARYHQRQRRSVADLGPATDAGERTIVTFNPGKEDSEARKRIA